MPDSIERLVRGFSVLRLLSVATLLLIVACLIISASIALADAPRAPADGGLDNVDIYEFDFEIEVDARPHPEHDEFSAFQDI